MSESAAGGRSDPPSRIERTARVAERWLAIAFLAIVALNFANVVGRYALGAEIHGADEIQIYTLVWLVFAGAAITASRDDHLRMDVLVRHMPSAIRRALRALECAFLTVVCGFAAWHSIRYVGQIVSIDRRSDVAGIPMGVPHAAVAVGLLLIAVIGLAALVQVLRGRTPAGAGE
jgi:TRAP-type C4-dicarboxylate transport system permease small subunit